MNPEVDTLISAQEDLKEGSEGSKLPLTFVTSPPRWISQPEAGWFMFEKTLSLVSLNVRGMRGNKAKPKQVKAWLTLLETPPQIILLQEHHLGKVEDRDLARGVEFWQGEALWNEGIPMWRSQRTRAGTVILLDKTVAPFIVDHDILDAGRSQFITLQPPGEGTLTIINVFAPNLSADRAQLWQKVSQPNLIADHFILGGDLNHQEPLEASNSLGTRQLSKREISAWHHMTLKYGLSDAWEFTFDNGQ